MRASSATLRLHLPVLRAALVAIAVSVLLGAGLAVVQPGLFRLVVLQPARDLVFFHRELDPLRHLAAIETRRPRPAETSVMPAADSAVEVDIVFDLWFPEQDRAPAVLLLHGSSPRGRALGFNRLLGERLSRSGFLVVTPDLPGFGQSGRPPDRGNPAAWNAGTDILRLVDFARRHPRADGRVVAVGHSWGASELLDVARQELPVLALVAIGPSRDSGRHSPTWWQRARFSADRRIGGLVAREIVEDAMIRHDLLQLANGIAANSNRMPILFNDGEREGESHIHALREATAIIGPRAEHVTVAGSYHYCGAYQLPMGVRTVYVRPDVFDRCADVVVTFLSNVLQ